MSSIVPWVAAGDLSCSPCSLDPEVVVKAATIIADALSGSRFGQRDVRLRPRALNESCGCRQGCGCGRVPVVQLTDTIAAITSVKVDGAVLSTDAWVLYADNRLARTDGSGFPCCQRLELDPDADLGTFEIACTIGAPVDEMGQLAVSEIACEIIAALDNPGSCRLPKHIQSLTRQQLAVAFTDPTTTLAAGFAGLPLTDLWLASLDAEPRRHAGRAVDLAALSAYREASSP